VLQVREVIGQRLHDAWVMWPQREVVRRAKVLRTFECGDVVAPELSLLGESSILCVEVEMHLAKVTGGHDKVDD
jgi:hypothetical protein